jgi:hypothetical protein
MDFKIVSKNNVGTVIALSLVIILSQAKCFNFLLDTALGRVILISFIIIISYMNKILGVVSVLFIIIMFNNSDIGYMEGFTSNTTPMNSKPMNTTPMNSKPMNSKPMNTTPMNSKPMNSTPMNSTPMKNNTASPAPASNAEKAKTTNDAAEGFDIIGTESTIKRGKPSNTISATKTVGMENFAPFSGSYSDSYSSF